MGCCIAAAFLISLVRRAWFALALGRPVDPELFAPMARRAAPGLPSVRATVPVVGPSSNSAARSLGLVVGVGLVLCGLAWLAFGVATLHVASPSAAHGCTCCCSVAGQVAWWQHVALHGSALLVLAAGVVVIARQRRSRGAVAGLAVAT